MEEAEALCDRLGVLDSGKLIAQGTLAELRLMVAERDVVRLSGVFAPDKARQALAGFGELEVIQVSENCLAIALADGPKRLPALLAALAAAGGHVHECTLTQPSLQSLFIRLTGKELRE